MNLCVARVLQWVVAAGFWLACCDGAWAQVWPTPPGEPVEENPGGAIEPDLGPPLCKAGGAPALDFGIYPGNSATLDTTSAPAYFTCHNTTKLPQNAQICVKLYNGTGGVVGNDRRLLNGSEFIRYQLYKDANRTLIWGHLVVGGQTNDLNNAAMIFGAALAPGQSLQIPMPPIYGRIHIPPGTPMPPAGVYQSMFAHGAGGWKASYQILPQNQLVQAGTACDPSYPGVHSIPVPTFTVQVKSDYYCEVITKDVNIYFGVHGDLQQEHHATGDFQLRCGPKVGYRISISHGMYGHHHMRFMRGDSGEDIGYQLYRNPQLNEVWGDVAGMIPGDVVGGMGTGLPQIHRIYAKTFVQPTPHPGLYKDKAVILVEY